MLTISSEISYYNRLPRAGLGVCHQIKPAECFMAISPSTLGFSDTEHCSGIGVPYSDLLVLIVMPTHTLPAAPIENWTPNL